MIKKRSQGESKGPLNCKITDRRNTAIAAKGKAGNDKAFPFFYRVLILQAAFYSSFGHSKHKKVRGMRYV
jgi:hypothetical protein